MSKPPSRAADSVDWNEAFAAVLRLVKARRSVLGDATIHRRADLPERAASPVRTYFAEIERATVSDPK